MFSLARHITYRGTSSQNAMMRIATAAVAVSVAVVIISLSVVFGFKSQISELISGTVADITVASPYGERAAERYPINDNAALRDLIASTGNIAHTERYALRSGIVRGEDGAMGILLKGIGEEADNSLFAERLIEGEIPRF